MLSEGNLRSTGANAMIGGIITYFISSLARVAVNKCLCMNFVELWSKGLSYISLAACTESEHIVVMLQERCESSTRRCMERRH